MSLYLLDNCVCGQTECLAPCPRPCGRSACAPTPQALSPISARAAVRRPWWQRLVRAWHVHRRATHLAQLERYVALCERGRNCSAEELRVMHWRVGEARVALAVAHGDRP